MFSKLMNLCKKKKRECLICDKEFNTDKEQEDHNNSREHKDIMEIEEMVWNELSGKMNPV